MLVKDTGISSTFIFYMMVNIYAETKWKGNIAALITFILHLIFKTVGIKYIYDDKKFLKKNNMGLSCVVAMIR